jgi:hypothetical protein
MLLALVDLLCEAQRGKEVPPSCNGHPTAASPIRISGVVA